MVKCNILIQPRGSQKWLRLRTMRAGCYTYTAGHKDREITCRRWATELQLPIQYCFFFHRMIALGIKDSDFWSMCLSINCFSFDWRLFSPFDFQCPKNTLISYFHHAIIWKLMVVPNTTPDPAANEYMAGVRGSLSRSFLMDHFFPLNLGGMFDLGISKEGCPQYRVISCGRRSGKEINMYRSFMGCKQYYMN